eukprot:gene179-942_t
MEPPRRKPQAFVGQHQTPIIDSPRSGEDPLRRLVVCWNCNKVTCRLNFCVFCGNFLFVQPGDGGSSSPRNDHENSLFVMTPATNLASLDVGTPRISIPIPDDDSPPQQSRTSDEKERKSTERALEILAKEDL